MTLQVIEEIEEVIAELEELFVLISVPDSESDD